MTLRSRTHLVVLSVLCAYLGIWLSSPEAQENASKRQIFREGTLYPKQLVTERIPIPTEYGGLEISLEPKTPDIDVSLYVYDSNPDAGNVGRPLCISESVDRAQVCAVRRPSSGEAWVVIQYFEAKRETPYRLTGSFISREAYDLLSLPEIKAGGGPMSIGYERSIFRLDLPEHSTAVVVLSDKDREFSVEDLGGSQYRVYSTREGGHYVALGRARTSGGMLIEEDTQPRRLLIRVGKKDLASLSLQGATISFIRTVDVSTSPFLVPFSYSQVDPTPLQIKRGGQAQRTGEIAQGMPTIYRLLLEEDERAVASVETGADLNLVFCTQFGQILNADGKELELLDRFAPSGSVSPQQHLNAPLNASPNFGRAFNAQDLYLIVLPDPFTQEKADGPFKLTIRSMREK